MLKKGKKANEGRQNTLKSIKVSSKYISINIHQTNTLRDSVTARSLPHQHLPLLLHCFYASVEKTLGLYRSDHPCPLHGNSLQNSSNGIFGIMFFFPNFRDQDAVSVAIGTRPSLQPLRVTRRLKLDAGKLSKWV